MTFFMRFVFLKAHVRALAIRLGILMALCGVFFPAQALAQADAAASPRMAMGVIVKLKDTDPKARTLASVVRLQASAMPSETRERLRERFEALKIRRRLPYLHHKPTAFAAELIHSGQPVPLSEAQAVAARLRADPEVAWAVPNELLRPATVTGATVTVSGGEFTAQPWIKHRIDAADRLGYADFATAWSTLAGRTLTPVVVAVLDSGILPLPDLAGRTFAGWDFVSEAHYSRDGGGMDADAGDEGDWLTTTEKQNNPTRYPDPCEPQDSLWHGLAIATLLAAAPGNSEIGGIGVLSPLPNQVVLPVRVAGTCGALTSDIIEGMLWAAGIDYQGSPARNLNPARVINISLGGEGDCSSNSVQSADWLYRQTVDRLRNKGVLVVASAGNGGANRTGLANVTRPASCAGVLSVTSLNAKGYKARYANLANSSKLGTVITRQKAHAVAVAGGDVAPSGSTWVISDDGINLAVDNGTQGPIGTYRTRVMAGTSFSAPMVAGVAALMLAVDPSLTVNELLSALSDQSVGILAPFPPASGSLPVCDPQLATGQCHCTTDTCGGGILDAEKAVRWALGRTAGASAYNSANEFSSEFIPDRERVASVPHSNGGGGGGAIDATALGGLAGALLAVKVMRRRKNAAGAIKTGRP
jgi:serine protease